MNTDFSAFATIYPTGESATRPLARLVGHPALSLLLAGMSLPRRRFAPAIPPKRTNSHVQLRFQGWMKHFCHGAVLLMTCTLAMATDAEMDMHFRPFAVEPADRIEFGHGHLVAGIQRDYRPESGTRHRDALPAEATLGIAAGFSVVLASELIAQTTFNDGQSSQRTGHEMRLRYSLPAWNNVHFALLTGQGRHGSEGTGTHTNGYSFTFDTALGDIGFGQTWDRQLPGETQRKQETGINIFRQGLGADGKWGLAAELRQTRTGNNAHLQHWLLGAARLLRPGLLADIALGGSSGEQRSHLITAGLSWFF